MPRSLQFLDDSIHSGQMHDAQFLDDIHNEMSHIQSLDNSMHSEMPRVSFADDSVRRDEFLGDDDDDDILDAKNHDDTEENLVKPREPLLLCKLVANRPHLSFGLVLGVHVLCVLVSVALVTAGYDLFPVDFEAVPLNLYHQPWLKRDLAFRHRLDFKDRINHKLPPDKTHTWPRSQRSYKSLMLLYDAGDNNIFTKDNLKIMQRIEDSLSKVKNYSDVCQLTQFRTCVPPLSVLRFFDGSLSIIDPVFNDPNFDNITGVIYTAYTLKATKAMFVFALGKSHTIMPSHVRVGLTRSIIPFGSSVNHKVMINFMATEFQPLLDDYLNTAQFRFLYYSELLMIEDGKKQGYEDMKLAIGSALFIFAFIFFHTRSLWTTCLAVFSIVCSFVETNLIYRVVIDFRYFGFFHVLVMFIILGIGADDLFVFWDAWKASELSHFPTLAHRLDQTYRKSAISMFVTSLTTMMAFGASALSPLLAIRSFGVFSAILVAIDYISVITFFPTIVIMHHLHFENKCRWWCFRSCHCNKRKSSSGPRTSHDGSADFSDGESCVSSGELLDATGRDQSRPRNLNTPVFRSRQSDVRTSVSLSTVSSQGADDESLGERNEFPSSETARQDLGHHGGAPMAQPEHRWLVLYFRDYHFWFVTHKVWRWVLLLLLLGLAAVFAVSASRLKPDNQQVGLFKESHHHSQAFRLASHGFMANPVDPTILLWLVWGIEERDMSSCHFSDYKCQGRQVYDHSFNPSTMAAQRSLQKLCDTMYNFTDQEIADLRIRRDLTTGKSRVFCFTKHLHSFLQNDELLSNVDVTLPWNQTKLAGFVTSLKSFYNTSIVNASYEHYLDIPVNFWLWDGFRQSNTADNHMYQDLLAEERTPFTTPLPAVPSVLVGNRLKFVAVQVSTTLTYETLFYTEHIPVLRNWEQFMQKQLSTMPPELKKGFQSTEVAWHWLYVQQTLVQNAKLGILLGVFLALPILVIATCNVINGLLATLTICCVTVCVIGVVPMAGWKLGVLVSLNMCLVVGLAVDYVVHLAEGYHMSHARDRKGRLKHALETMGISVFSGACTTLGASVFMLFAQIQFFYQFGIFMFCTIGFSLLFSMGLYITVMGLLGPEGQFGDIRVPVRVCRARMNRRKPAPRLEITSLTSRRNSDEELLIA